MCSYIVYEEDFEADDEGPVEDGDEVEEDPSTAANGGEKETKYRDEKEKSNSDSDVASMSSTHYFMVTLFSNNC